MGQTYISTEHLLLGILREDACGALRVLSELGIEADAVRSALNDGSISVAGWGQQ